VQGPTRVAHDTVADAIVASADGTIALHVESHQEGGRSVSTIELRAPGVPTRRTKLPGTDPPPPQVVFRGSNVIGFGARTSPVVSRDAYVVWATLSPLALFASPVGGSVERAGSRVYFNDKKCIIHALDLETGADRSGSAKACSWFRVWGDAIAIGEPKIANGYVVGVDFGGRVIAADTGKPQESPHCPHPVGKACLTFADDLLQSVDDDPPGPGTSPAQTETFEVRGARGEHVRGETVRPHSALSPDHFRLWRDAAGRTFAFVASRVEGSVGPQLVVVDESRVVVTPLSREEEVDQRRIARLRSFVPATTPPEDVDVLVREREKALAASATDRVRFMDYAAATSAQIPCSAPPP
jgi:hypothetical protein